MDFGVHDTWVRSGDIDGRRNDLRSCGEKKKKTNHSL